MVHPQLIEHLAEQLQVLVHGALPDDARAVLRMHRERECREKARDEEESTHRYFPPTDESAVRRAWARGLNSWFCDASAMNRLYCATASAVLPSPSYAAPSSAYDRAYHGSSSIARRRWGSASACLPSAINTMPYSVRRAASSSFSSTAN